jgi:flavin-dependent thymidylate synthase
MQVNLIDHTGKGAENPTKYAADLLIYIKNTRLELGPETREKIAAMPADEAIAELDYISKTIRSSWEFVDFTFEILGVTRAFTHQFVRTRVGISFAQQAQRVVDMSGFKALRPQTVTDLTEAQAVWNSVMLMINQGYERLIELGIPNQDARGILPTNILTNINAKLNLRTLADLVGKRENLRAQGEYSDVVAEFKRLALGVFPWCAPFLDPERTRTPFLDALLARELGSAGPLDKPDLNAALKELDALKAVWG